jgi:hypothetical protein
MTKKRIIKQEKTAELKASSSSDEIKSKTVIFSSEDIYDYNNKKFELNILNAIYSNDQSVQSSEDELLIDFFMLPGYKKENTIIINTIRIYMNHQTARVLAKNITEMLQSDTDKFKKS